jgi:drug/metabolite transporter (DMT)-like permease
MACDRPDWDPHRPIDKRCLQYTNDGGLGASTAGAHVIAWLHALSLFASAPEARSLMDSHKRLHLKTFFMILIMVIAGPLGKVLLGKGMQSIGPSTVSSFADLAHVSARVAATSAIWLGVALQLLFFVAYLLVLSWADYSFVQPASSMAYGFVALLSVLVLGEGVSPQRWAGIVIICLGVFIVGRTNPRTTEHH